MKIRDLFMPTNFDVAGVRAYTQAWGFDREAETLEETSAGRGILQLQLHNSQGQTLAVLQISSESTFNEDIKLSTSIASDQFTTPTLKSGDTTNVPFFGTFTTVYVLADGSIVYGDGTPCRHPMVHTSGSQT